MTLSTAKGILEMEISRDRSPLSIRTPSTALSISGRFERASIVSILAMISILGS